MILVPMRHDDPPNSFSFGMKRQIPYRPRRSWTTKVLSRESWFADRHGGPPGSPFGPQARYLAPYGGNEIRPQGSFQRGPRHQGGHPAAENHHSGAKKVVSGSNGASSGSIMVSWWHPEKVKIFDILVDFHSPGTPPAGPPRPLEVPFGAQARYLAPYGENEIRPKGSCQRGA